MPSHQEVSRDEWIEARQRWLVKEQEFPRLRDPFSPRCRIRAVGTGRGRRFYKDATGAVVHTDSTDGHGIDMVNVDYGYLDRVLKRRDQAGRGAFRVRRHEESDSRSGLAGKPSLIPIGVPAAGRHRRRGTR